MESYIQSVFLQYPAPFLKYHDFEHTKTVAENCSIAARQLKLNEEETSILETAAWFHDIGYLFGYDNHEKRSIDFAVPYLTSLGNDAEFIQRVSKCIAATEIGVSPDGLLESLLKDIDVSYGIMNGFEGKGNALRAEWKNCRGLVYTDEKWLDIQENFLMNVVFHTDYAKHHFAPMIETLLESIKK